MPGRVTLNNVLPLGSDFIVEGRQPIARLLRGRFKAIPNIGGLSTRTMGMVLRSDTLEGVGA
jgi:hypothetical protein